MNGNGKGVEETLGDVGGSGGDGDVLHQHCELVATKARRCVDRPQHPTQPIGDGDQDLIAGGMAEGVVHLLEAVDVHEEHRDGRRISLRPGQCMSHPVLEQPSVRQAGERVLEGLLLVEPPCHDARGTGGEDETTVDQGPLERVGDSVWVVVDLLGCDRSHDAVVQDHKRDGGQKGQPVLVEREDRHHDEEVEMKFDHAAGEVDQHGGCGDQANGDEGRARSATEALTPAQHSEHADDGGLGDGMDE